MSEDRKLEYALLLIYERRGKLMDNDKQASEELWDCAKTIEKYFDIEPPFKVNQEQP